MRKLGFSISALVLGSFIVFAPPVAAGGSLKDTVPVPFSWTGFYVGGTLGGAFTDADRNPLGCENYKNIIATNNTFTPDGCVNEFDADIIDGPSTGSVFPAFEFPVGDYIARKSSIIDEDDGFLYGVHIGANKQFGSHVVGIEIDFSGASGVEESTVTKFEHFGTLSGGNDLSEYLGEGTFAIEDEIDWLSTARIRLGHVFGANGRFMGYITGGLAVAEVSRSVRTNYDETGKNANSGAKCDPNAAVRECFFTSGRGVGSFYQAGFVVGAGGEWAITDKIILGAEYLYTELYGDETSSVTFVGDQGRSLDLEGDGGFDVLHALRVRLSVKTN